MAFREVWDIFISKCRHNYIPGHFVTVSWQDLLTIEDSFIFLGTRIYAPHTMQERCFRRSALHSFRYSIYCEEDFFDLLVIFLIPRRTNMDLRLCSVRNYSPENCVRDISSWKQQYQPYKRVHMDFCHFPKVDNIFVLLTAFQLFGMDRSLPSDRQDLKSDNP